MELRIEVAKAEDLSTIRTFYWKLLEQSPELASVLRWKKHLYPADRDWLMYIERQEMYLVYEDGALIAAFALTERQSEEYCEISWQTGANDNEVAVIHLLAVAPSQQGRGLATKTLNAICQMAKHRGKKSLRLDAIETNVPAQRLYEKYGFEKCGWSEAYYESVGLAGFYFYEYVL